MLPMGKKSFRGARNDHICGNEKLNARKYSENMLYIVGKKSCIMVGMNKN